LSLAFIGHTTLDDTVHKAGRFQISAPGGAAVYAAIAASIWVDGVLLITKVGQDYPHEYIERIQNYGINTTGIITLPGESIRNWILYYHDNRRSILWQNSNPRRFRLRMTPSIADIKKFLPDITAVHIAPMHPLYQSRLVNLFQQHNIPMSLDTMSVQLINNKSRDLLLKVLKSVTFFAPSIEEVDLLGGGGSLKDKIKRIHQLGPQVVVVKMGDQGSVVMDRAGKLVHCPVCPIQNLVDVTGAGDSFCGGFLAGYIKSGDLRHAQLCGTVSASLMIEGFGALHADPDRLRAAAASRYQSLAKRVDEEG
jgi:sugar/nucleoside kinase (ribokinase family)